MKQKQFVHEYKGYNGAESHCRLSFYLAATGATVAVVDELPTNEGTPVRDFAEHLATQAYRLVFPPNGAHVEEFLYVEHTPGEGELQYSYNLVEFDWEEEGEQFIHPRRTPLTDEEMQTLLGEDQDDDNA